MHIIEYWIYNTLSKSHSYQTPWVHSDVLYIQTVRPYDWLNCPTSPPCIYFFFHIVFVVNVFTHTVEILHVFRITCRYVFIAQSITVMVLTAAVSSKAVGRIDCQSLHLCVLILNVMQHSHKVHRGITKPTVAAELKVKWCGLVRLAACRTLSVKLNQSCAVSCFYNTWETFDVKKNSWSSVSAPVTLHTCVYFGFFL